MSDSKWVAGWGAASTYVVQTSCIFLENMTFRYIIFPTMKASKVRLHYSNRFGTRPVTITKTVLAIQTAAYKTDVSTNTAVTFGGSPSLTLAPGEETVSDEIAFAVTPGKQFTVSNYFAGMTEVITGHTNGGHYIEKYYARGDLSESETMPLETRNGASSYIFLNTIDFLTESGNEAIVAFGDSITAQPWPDCLAHRIFDAGIYTRSVIRRGIGGNRILRGYKYRCRQHFGEAGISRFERDTSVAGAGSVLVLEGINDLGHPQRGSELCPYDELPTADEMIAGLRLYIKIAHGRGQKIHIATTTPGKLCLKEQSKEDIRLAVNDWIRTAGEDDGFIDFEKAVRQESDPSLMRPECDSGDHLHPSFTGACAMADSIPMEYII